MNVPLIVGVALIVVGLVGVRYAPRVVAAQHSQRMAPYEDAAEIDDDDRVQVTRGVGVLCTIVGFALVVYGIS
ncbi:hypothetical protein [Natrononativus amylolyticus]|uniref:hypothetical protein n=1 Tax=Natrononativus amylolyticus TaxID=2963434 RepID=UPI0020CB812A|nr:hypothetical protein [Natrononativus amylolyticus]